MSKIDFDRTIGLISQDNFDSIQTKTICVIGLGGVGGTALESLARIGFTKFVIIDKDIVDPTNLNRQILYTECDLFKSKVESAGKYLKMINKEIELVSYNSNINDINLEQVLLNNKVDFVVDAIDDVKGKIYIASICLQNNINFIMSLGMANRFDPSKVSIKLLDKTTDDPLAKKIRYEVRKEGLNSKNITCVFSTETPKKDGTKLNSIITVPSSAGLNIAYYTLMNFIKE